jgi:hypothetical protein
VLLWLQQWFHSAALAARRSANQRYVVGKRGPPVCIVNNFEPASSHGMLVHAVMQLKQGFAVIVCPPTRKARHVDDGVSSTVPLQEGQPSADSERRPPSNTAPDTSSELVAAPACLDDEPNAEKRRILRDLLRFAVACFEHFDSAIASAATGRSRGETWAAIRWLEEREFVRIVWIAPTDDSDGNVAPLRFIAWVNPSRFGALRDALGADALLSPVEKLKLLRQCYPHLLYFDNCHRYFAHELQKEWLRVALQACASLEPSLGSEDVVVAVAEQARTAFLLTGQAWDMTEKVGHIPAFRKVLLTAQACETPVPESPPAQAESKVIPGQGPADLPSLSPTRFYPYCRTFYLQ